MEGSGGKTRKAVIIPQSRCFLSGMDAGDEARNGREAGRAQKRPDGAGGYGRSETVRPGKERRGRQGQEREATPGPRRAAYGKAAWNRQPGKGDSNTDEDAKKKTGQRRRGQKQKAPRKTTGRKRGKAGEKTGTFPRAGGREDTAVAVFPGNHDPLARKAAGGDTGRH